MKKIGIYLSSSPYSGGSFQYTLTLLKNIKQLDKKKYEINVFINNKIWKKYLPKNFITVELKKNSIIDNYLNYISLFLFSKKIFKKLCNIASEKIRQINKIQCDLIIFPAQEELSSKVFAKSVTTIHDLMHKYESNFKEYSFFERVRRDFFYSKICENSKAILVDSSIGKFHVIENYGVQKNKIFISKFEVPEYLKSSKVFDIHKKYKLPKKKFIFYPAQFWEHKNHINLIKAFNLVRKKIKNIDLVLVGVEKNNLTNVKNEIKNLKIEKFVHILGYIKNDDVFSFYKKASLLSYVSYCGPTNIPPLEAMYSGCPMICSNVYGMKKQVGNSALMINPKSHLDIYKKIMKILNDRIIQKKLVKNGFNQLRKNKNNLNICKILEKINF